MTRLSETQSLRIDVDVMKASVERVQRDQAKTGDKIDDMAETLAAMQTDVAAMKANRKGFLAAISFALGSGGLLGWLAAFAKLKGG